MKPNGVYTCGKLTVQWIRCKYRFDINNGGAVDGFQRCHSQLVPSHFQN